MTSRIFAQLNIADFSSRTRGLVIGAGILVALALLCTGNAQSCEPWQAGEPFPFGQSLYDVTLAGDLWVAVGRSGTILTSPNTVNWTRRESGFSRSIYHVAGHDGRLVAVGNPNILLISDVGVDWTATGTIPLENVYDLLWTGTFFVAVGKVDDSTEGIATSQDGSAWTIDYKCEGGLGFLSVTMTDFGPVATGGMGDTVRFDGVTWQKISSKSYLSVASNGPMMVASTYYENGWAFDWSDDGGETWNWATFPEQRIKSPDLIWTGEVFLAFGASHFGEYKPLTVLGSYDGKRWTEIDRPSEYRMYGAAGTRTETVFVGEWGAIKGDFSTTGWTTLDPGSPIGLYHIASSDTRAVGVGTEGFGATTTDGVEWDSFRLAEVERFEDVIWSPPSPDHSDGRFLAVGWHEDPIGAVVASSSDGLTWTVQGLFPGIRLFGVTATDFGFVAVGHKADTYEFASLRSLDGADWTSHQTSHHGWWYSRVAWNGESLVATSANNLYVSTDGTSWTHIGAYDNYFYNYFVSGFHDIATDGSNFVVILDDEDRLAHIWSSPDGLTWNHEIGPLNIMPRAIEYIGDRFLVSGIAYGYTGFFESAAMLWYALDGTLAWPDLSDTQPGFFYGTTLMGNKVVAVDTRGQTVSVDLPPEPVPSQIEGPTIGCNGDTGTLSTNPILSDLLWSTGEDAESITVPFTSGPENYWAVGTDAQSCRTSTPLHTVTAFYTPQPYIDGPRLIHLGESAELIASEGLGYLWSTGETTRNNVVAPVQTTEYTVSVTDENGCDRVSRVHTISVVGGIFSDGFETGDTSRWPE